MGTKDKAAENKKDEDIEEDDEELEEEESDEEEQDAADKSGDSGKAKTKTFTEGEVESIVKNRLRREKRKLADTIREEVRADLASSKKDGDGDIQAQLDRANERIKQLESLEELEELAEERYDRELDDLPEAIKMLAPDDDASILDKERWLVNKAQPALARMKADAGEEKKPDGESKETKKAKRGADHKDPKPVEKDDRSSVEKLVAEARKSVGYRPLM